MIALMIDENSIQTLKQRLDIVEVVGHYLELKKSGASYRCLCPFHNDSNPSMHVSPQKQIYHCFSCGAGGDAIKFVMEFEKLSYPETIEKLANLYNFSLNYVATAGEKRVDKKVLEALNSYYKTNLQNHSIAKEYVLKRGITNESIEKFSIGYAPSSGQTLSFLKNHGFAISDAKEVGAADVGEGGRPYARFIERVTFPIFNPSGKIVGFGGRTISGHMAKYVNSPQSKVFNKSYLLYGYNLAQKSIFQTKQIIVTEGYLDVIMLHQAGFTNSVATLGTALTKEHLPLLSRGEPSIVLSYDGDEAGIQAAIKASRLLSAQGASGGCVIFSDGEDPADLIFNKEVEKVRALFSKPIPFVEFYIDESIKNYNLKDPVEKQRAFEELVQFLNELPSAIAHSYRGILANKLNLDGSMIKLTNRGFTRSKNAFVNEDILELTILKSVLNEPNFLDLVLDVVDPSMFKTHMIEFDKIVKGDLNSPQIRRLMLWEDIKIYNEEELIAALISFMNTHYLSVLERVKKDSTLSFEKKSFLIRKIQHTIFKLKKGELVPYESFSSF